MVLSLASDSFFTLVLINILLDTWGDCSSPRVCVMCSLSLSLPATSSFVLSGTLSPANSSHFSLSGLSVVSCQLGKPAMLCLSFLSWHWGLGNSQSNKLGQLSPSISQGSLIFFYLMSSVLGITVSFFLGRRVSSVPTILSWLEAGGIWIWILTLPVIHRLWEVSKLHNLSSLKSPHL